MKMVVNQKLNVGDVEGEDYDCAALESSLSSLLGFLDPSSREPTSAMDVDKKRTVSDTVKAAKREAGAQQPFQAEVEVEVSAGEAGSTSESIHRRNKNSSGGASSASCGENANLGIISCSGDKEGLGAAAQPREPSSFVQHQNYQTPLQQAISEEVSVVTKRASSSSCSSDGAGSSNAATVSPDLGLKVADMCRATVRDMLKEVLLETLPLQNAVEVLFKMDSHSGWNAIRACATAILASSSTFRSGSIATAAFPALSPMYRGSASLPSTPAKTCTDSFTAGGNLPSAPPLLPPLTAPPMHLKDVADASARGRATSPEAPPSLPPPPPASGPAALSSVLPLAGSTLAPLTPARSAPGAIPAPGPIYGSGSVSSPTRADAGGRVPAGSGESTPLASGPSSIASAPAAGALDGSGAGPSSSSPPLLTSLLQQHPHLVDCLQHHPQLLSSILNMAGGSGGTSTGGVVSAEVLSAKSASAAAPAFDEVHAGGGAGGYGVVLAGLHHHPQLGSPLTSSGMRSPPSLSSPAAHGAGIWGSPIPSRGSPISVAGPFGSPQSHAGAQSGLEAFHALMGSGGGVPGGGQGVGMMLQGTDPNAAGYSCKTFEELSLAVRDKIQSVLDTCGPHIRAEHFDAGVRHWLLQLQMLFGEMCAVSALHAIETAANLEGVRRMKAFITTRLIDHYEQMVWAQDPQGYAMRKLTPDLIAVLEELVQGDKGLRWTHFDPKVLDTIREIRTPDAVRTRLSKLCAQELNGVQNVPAYLYTLLSKRGKTAKQAAAQKQMQELALRLAAAQGVGIGMGF
ncbi:hypothetical protein Vafri_20073, partial [Volvox africanus]